MPTTKSAAKDFSRFWEKSSASMGGVFAAVESLAEYFVCGFIFFTPLGHGGASICFGLLALCFAVRKILCPDFGFLNKTEHLWLLLFFIFCSFSLVNSGPYLEKSLAALFLKWGKYLVVFMLFRETLIRPTSQKRVRWAILSTAAIVGVDCLFQLFTGADLFYANPILHGLNNQMLTATFKNPNDLASYLGLVVLVTLAMAVFATTQKSRWMLWTLTGILVACLFFTFSRGAWIGFLGGCLLMTSISRRWRVLLPIALLFIAMTFLSAPLASKVGSGLSLATGLQPVFFSHRDELWKMGFQLVQEDPFLGKGLGTFMDYCGQRLFTIDANYAHNCYLQIWAESGIYSLLAFLLFIGTVLGRAIKTFKKNDDPFLLGLLCGIVAFLIHSFFDTQFYSVSQSYLLWSMLGILAAAPPNAPILLFETTAIKQTYSVLGALYKHHREVSSIRRARLLAEKNARNDFLGRNMRVLASLGMTLAIIVAVVVRFFASSSWAETQNPTIVQNLATKAVQLLPPPNVPKGPDSTNPLPGPVNETSEVPAKPAIVAPAEIVKSFDVRPVAKAISRPIPKASLAAPTFNPANLRKKYANALEMSGVNDKDEAMEFSLVFWEKKRKAYSL
jgi:O-antigen ligase